MSTNPVTLLEESDWEMLERQRQTGVLGTGLHVDCHPDLDDREIQQVQHRAVCILRLYTACWTCPHQVFTLVFKAQPKDPYEHVACPRWRSESDRLVGYAPESYVPVERSMCSQRPLNFCSSCPSEEELVQLGADKVRAGWYGRWHRLRPEGSNG